MDLPKAATGGEVQQIFSLSLRADGTTQVDGVLADGDDIVLQRARDASARHAELRAVVQADGSVPHSRVMHELDVLRQAGISRIAFGVLPGLPVEGKRSE